MSLRKAINDKCKECIYDPYAKGLGSWRQQVKDCTSPDCPLFRVRPLPEKGVASTKTAPFEAQNGRTTEREGVVA